MDCTIKTNFCIAIDVIEQLLPSFIFIIMTTIIVVVLYRLLNNKKIIHYFSTLLAFSFFGGTIGILMGASQLPVITSLLPAIITLVSGYLVLKGDEAENKELNFILPIATFLLLINLVFSAFYLKAWYATHEYSVHSDTHSMKIEGNDLKDEASKRGQTLRELPTF